ncbi:MAG: HAMP domain-containing sensor histidine kinase [Acidobacteriota bacterium]
MSLKTIYKRKGKIENESESTASSDSTLYMKRSWISILAICGFIGLLVLLGVLQYRWLSQVSEAEIEKQQKRLDSDTEHFAADFNREIQGAYFNFQIGSDAWKKKDWTEFNKRYDFWRSKTAYPSLIKSVVFVENRPDAEPLVYNAEKRTFEPGEVPAAFASLRARFSADATFQPVYDDVPALVTPIHDPIDPVRHIFLREHSGGTPPRVPMPPKFGYLAVILDAATLKDQVLPELDRKYFPEGDFVVSVADKAGTQVFHTSAGTNGADASARLLDVSPDNLMFYTSTDMMPGEGERRSDVFVSKRVESRTLTTDIRGDGAGGIMKIEVNRGQGPKTTVLERTNPDAVGFWTLQVQHRAGSIANFVAGAKRQSLAISFGLLGLLGAGILLIFISAQRARTLAQRQIDFVSSVSHEFRTPLAVIYSAGENLADGVAKEEGQVTRYGAMIKGEGKKLSGMVEQILEFAGADSGRRKYNFRETDIGDVVNDALDECMPMLREKQFDVETDISNDLPSVAVDRDALSGAVQNLLQNSAKYSNGTKWLRLSAASANGRVRIAVEDHGIGISRSDLRQIFQPFFRSKAVVDSQIHGSGLGLSLVKQIAEAHGGKVYAESEVGKGSKFTIDLAAEKSEI